MKRYLGKYYAKGWTLCKGCGGDILKSEGKYCSACGPVNEARFKKKYGCPTCGSLTGAWRAQDKLESSLSSTLKKGKYHR